MKKYLNFVFESISKPELKYPVEKCLDFLRFQIEMEKEGLEILEIHCDEYGSKQIIRNTGNFYTIFDKMDPLFPKITTSELHNKDMLKKNAK